MKTPDYRATTEPYIYARIGRLTFCPVAETDPAVRVELAYTDLPINTTLTARLIAPSETLWLLERTGTELSSEALSARIERLPVEGTSQLTIVIAGTYGAAPPLLARAQFRWSLSQLTLLHEWARVLVLEQLYRAAKIAANEPYHH